MKKLINSPQDAVRESLEGLALAYPDLVKVHFEPTFVYRASPARAGKVALISGGGSGHEPLHSGFVGRGMLDAACPGEIFTSPTPDQMLEAAKAAHSGGGVLFIVKNYSGDVMNFEMAGEMVREEGIKVATVLIDDDVAVKDSLYTQGRRGVAATVLAEKICGAAAEAGYDLDKLANLCRRVEQNGRSMGIALSSCTPPAKGSPIFQLGDEEAELGIGIHGEPGRERIRMPQADKIAELLALPVIEDGPYLRKVREWDPSQEAWVEIEITSPPLKAGDSVLAFVNGMGGTPSSELYVIFRALSGICRKKGLRIVRSLVGTYVTSLEMQGCSVTLLKVDDEMVSLWDSPANTPALRWGC